MGLSVGIAKAVEGFSLDVQWDIGQELAVLFGYSGAGKSITLNLIAGLMKPDAGHVRLGGKTCFDSSLNINLRPQERPLGYVFQDSALMPHMTVRGNILFGAKGMGRDEKHERAGEMLKSFHLTGLEDKLPSEISGGQKQRVALARALIGRPGALLLDEPFSALDNPIRVEMRRLLRTVREEFDIPVVLVTHDIYEANEMADRVLIYCDGRVAQCGSPSEVFSRPATRKVATLVNAERLSERIFSPVLQSFS